MGCVLKAARERDVELFAKVAVEEGVRDIKVADAAINDDGVRQDKEDDEEVRNWSERLVVVLRLLSEAEGD